MAAALSWIVLGVLFLVVLHAIGIVFHDGFVLDLGRRDRPGTIYAAFLSYWCVFGTGAVASWCIGFAKLFERTRPRRGSATRFVDLPAKLFIFVAVAAGVAVPVALRTLVLDGAPLTDDEDSYRFMAELLASGRLTAPEPAHKEFFDRIFMVNDGRYYAQYFLGWPALMVPGVWLGISEYMAAVYNGLTVIPLYLVIRAATGEGVARLTVVVFLLAPLVSIGAATQMSHTACVFALMWTIWAFGRTRDRAAPLWSHVLFSTAFCVAFFVRPLSALAVCLPFVVVWFFETLRRGNAARPLLGFLIPAVSFAALFLWVNHAQNGSVWLTAYSRYQRYVVDNEYRFTTLGHWDMTAVPGMDFTHPSKAITNTGLAFYRLNFALFGWPTSFLFAICALGVRAARLPWASFGSFFAFHAFSTSLGVDTFGPVHFYEIVVPVLLLTAHGLRSTMDGASGLVRAWGRPWLQALPLGALSALVASSVAGYTPVRLYNVHRIAENVNIPRRTAEALGLSNAVIFSPRHFAPNCLSAPTTHFVNFRPNNDPELRNDLLWVNDLGPERNQELLGDYPGRRAYVMAWKEPCRVVFHELPR